MTKTRKQLPWKRVGQLHESRLPLFLANNKASPKRTSSHSLKRVEYRCKNRGRYKCKFLLRTTPIGNGQLVVDRARPHDHFLDHAKRRLPLPIVKMVEFLAPSGLRPLQIRLFALTILGLPRDEQDKILSPKQVIFNNSNYLRRCEESYSEPVKERPTFNPLLVSFFILPSSSLLP